MALCAAVLVEEPEALRGRWLAEHPPCTRLELELGCGKGRFTCDTAAAAPETLLAAVEKVPDAMVLAMERCIARGLSNVRFMDRDAARLPLLFAPGEVSRIYINFCDPWPKSRDAKFRLTAPAFLRLYADALPLGGQIWFKTDNAPLFAWSLKQFEAEGWALSEVTDDLHANGPVGVMTDYEAKFHEAGVPIHRLAATRVEGTKTTAAGPVPRLRDAALEDARGGKPAVPELRLAEATRELCHAFYRRFEHDPALFEDASKLTPYRYDAEKVDAYFTERQKRTDRRSFFVLLGEKVIGELVFKKLDPEKKSCELGICLVNDGVKGRGFGTAALRLALEKAFGEFGIETVLADSLLNNTRSQHILQKLGFEQTAEDEHFRYFRITKEQYAREGKK